jgi:hypothetical protein
MTPQDVTSILTGFGRLVESGFDVDHGAVRACVDAAKRSSHTAGPGQVHAMMIGFTKLTTGGLAVDPNAVRAYADALIGASDKMNRSQVHTSSTSLLSLAESGVVDVDPVAVRALRDAAARVADDATDAQRTETLAALEKLTGLGSDASPASGARAPSGALSPSAAEATTPAAFGPDPHLALAAAAHSWLSALPVGKRAKLEIQLDAAATPLDKWQVLKGSAEGDDTRVRAPARRALLLQVEEETLCWLRRSQRLRKMRGSKGWTRRAAAIETSSSSSCSSFSSS